MKFVELGKIVKAHGFRGAFVVQSLSGDEAIFRSLETLFLGPDPEHLTSYRVKEAAWMPKGWKIVLEGIESDTQVAALIGLGLYAERGALPQTEKNEYYVTDLVGATVMDAATGAEIGKISGVEPGILGQDRWWVETAKGEVGIPANAHFVQRVETIGEGRRVWIQNFHELT